MVTWRLDRLFRSGAACGLAACLVPLAMAAVIGAQASDQRAIFAGLAVSVLVMAVAVVAGSSQTMGAAMLIYGVVVVVERNDPLAFGLVGVGLFVSMVLLELSITFRRAPAIDRAVWAGTAAVTTTIVALSGLAFFVAYRVATGSVWDTAMVPVALIAFGLASQFLAERHLRRLSSLRRATRKSSLMGGR